MIPKRHRQLYSILAGCVLVGAAIAYVIGSDLLERGVRIPVGGMPVHFNGPDFLRAALLLVLTVVAALWYLLRYKLKSFALAIAAGIVFLTWGLRIKAGWTSYPPLSSLGAGGPDPLAPLAFAGGLRVGIGFLLAMLTIVALLRAVRGEHRW